jgi:hypothetical protein
MGLFHFADGSMVSEYVGGDALECQFYTVVEGEKTGVDDELLGEKGISYFTLRAVYSLAQDMRRQVVDVGNGHNPRLPRVLTQILLILPGYKN